MIVGTLAVVGVLLVCLGSSAAQALDRDGDGVVDHEDNCVDVANSQLDSDLDGYGNACDADFDDSGFVGQLDLMLLQQQMGLVDTDPAYLPEVDLNGDGAIATPDWIAASALQGLPPGPSGLACAGTSGCTPPPPLPALPVVQVIDASPRDGRYDQYDVDVALAVCGAGCNLLFLPGTYDDLVITIDSFPLGFAMYGYGWGVTRLRSPVFGQEAWRPLIEIRANAPDGIAIERMTVDGRKYEQVPPLLGDGSIDHLMVDFSRGISTVTPHADPRVGGSLRGLEVRDFASGGIALQHAPSWTVEENLVVDIGCHQVDSPCGLALPGRNPWNGVPEPTVGPDTRVPGWKASGIGIVVLSGSSATVVRGNYVAGAVKMGISVYLGHCPGPYETADVEISDNTVTRSTTGISLNGGCRIRVTDNIAHFNRVTGGERTNLGAGFTCGGHASGSEWARNLSQNNMGAGYRIGCVNSDALVFRDNVARNNCANPNTTADLAFDGYADDLPDGLLIENFRSENSGCLWGIGIRRRRNVEVRGADVAGGSLGGIVIADSEEVEVHSSVFRSGPGAGRNDAGVTFQYAGTVSPTHVYVQPSTVLSDFVHPVWYSGNAATGRGIGDGDSVGACTYEPNPPARCDNAP